MGRNAIPSWFFVLVVVRKDDKYLLVQEAKAGKSWYLPAGRVEPGENFFEAAERETLEEAGIPIEIEGILRIQHTPGQDSTRVRVIFLAKPVDDTPPKSVADKESLCAKWVSLTDMIDYPLRGKEVLQLFKYVAQDKPIYPLDLLSREGSSI